MTGTTKLLIFLSLILITATSAWPAYPKFRHVASKGQINVVPAALPEEEHQGCHYCDSVKNVENEMKTFFDSLNPDSTMSDYYNNNASLLFSPLIFSGYRYLPPKQFKNPPLSVQQLLAAASDFKQSEDVTDENMDEVNLSDSIPDVAQVMETESETDQFKVIPEWLSVAVGATRQREDIRYRYMMSNPDRIYCAYRDLPKSPGFTPLPEQAEIENDLFSIFSPLRPEAVKIDDANPERVNWLHYFNIGLQFSQAYVSTNWYQGGNNYLALLFNFDWNVDLNTVYHPNLLFQSALSYKLGVNSNPKEAYHRYSFSQDNFQYNLKMGLKAFNHWFYSFNMQFKTSLFNAYPEDSYVRSAGFLSPGSLNLGLGMTYTLENEKKTFKLSASISPISYNLKTCLIDEIDHTQYGITPGSRTGSEIGSNAEANMTWKIADNILWTSRLFLFSDYKYFLADWENTLSFTINKFLSTQLYLHPRFDSSSDFNASKWHYWMLKEILSFGLSYTFSTKP